ncbi:MAG TPA: hypothetical protein PKA00_12285 [Saprospiraceae bacterium]|nr:hypothetical protein [Saprospiraceae bacterium]HMQ83685.1 hypothetical protein [Saprospiraceae bacterium]
MRKTTLIIFCGLWMLLFNDKLQGADAFWPLQAAWDRDTVPDREEFDRPLNGTNINPWQPELFKTSEDAPKVIPLVTIETEPIAATSKLPKDFDGFKVEILASPEALPEDHAIYFQHGNILVEKLANGQFSYLIGDFESLAETEAFIAQFLIEKYPKARPIEYEAGERAN